MKKTFNWLFTVVFFSVLSACTSNSSPAVTAGADTSDSKSVADSANQAKYDTTNMAKDAKFAVNAADGGMTEVQASKLALTNASMAEVKTMAQKMIDDHSKANDELKALAQKYSITIPSAISSDNQEAYDKLIKMNGKDFDKAYINKMVDDHKGAADLFETESEKGNNAELKQWAANTLPTIKSHLQMWEDIKNKMK
jgi:putative membrane protein